MSGLGARLGSSRVTSTPVSEPFPRRAQIAVPSGASIAFLAVGAVALLIYYLIPGNEQDVWYVVIGVSSVGAVAFAAHRMEHMRLAWYLFAAGISMSVIADAISSYYEIHLNREPPVASTTAGFYFASYPLLLTGIFLLLRELGTIRSRVAALDALIVAAAAGTVQWIFFVDPYLHAAGRPVTRGVEMAYPTLDLLMFVALAQVLLAASGRIVAYQLLVASVLLWIVGDEIFGLSVDNYHAGGWVDAFWLGSYIVWGAAALDPSAVRPLFRDRREVPRLTVSRLTLLAGALLTMPAVILIEHSLAHHNLHPKSIAVGSALVAILVVIRFAGLVRAVERARAAERLANNRLRELDQLKDEFLSTVSHELRTPLMSISGYVELARERADPEAREYLNIVERNADRLLALVNDLLFVARLQSGGVELEPAAVDVGQLVQESVASAQPHAASSGIELRLRLTGADTRVSADRRRLGQVIDNLVSNAIKFSPEGGEVDLAVGAIDGVITIEVTDRGIGIPEEERSRLFERFFRSSTALDRQIPGTGLGLYISKAIVEAHGGTIRATSALGSGSSFVVELRAAA